MERVKVLIDKLIQQQQRNEGVEAMLLTTQLLQNELLLLQKKNTSPVTSKVTVVMPSSANPVFKREPKPMPAPETKIEEPVSIKKEAIEKEAIEKEAPASVQTPPVYKVPPVPQTAPVTNIPLVEEQSQPEPSIFEEVKTPEPVSEMPPVMMAADNPEHEAYMPPRQKVHEPIPEPEKDAHPLVMENQFDAIEDTPTLAQYQPSKKDLKLQKEINDLIGESKETLNDRLKENKKELAHLLKETPIKDLRKAIGVNDRFVFVNELFRGDETMYERSIKTINGFHILPEAEYWINRELKVKLGWDDYKDSVQHFYHLVRRRFS
jgi:hypothetical protein